MKTTITLFFLAMGTTAFAATGQSGGSAGGAVSVSGSASGNVGVSAQQTAPLNLRTPENPFFPSTISNGINNANSSNSMTASNRFVANTNRFEGTNNLSPTGRSLGGTNELLTNSVANDQALSQSDQNILIILRQNAQNQLGVTTMGAMPVHFLINNGVVIIVGAVPNQQTSDRILFNARQTPGVVQVQNRMRVGTLALQSEPAAPAFVGTTTDHAFSSQDQSLLMSVRERVSQQLHLDGAAFVSLPIHLSIQNGVVGVSGKIGTGQQKQELLSAIQSTPGVTRVVDNLQLGAEPATAEPAGPAPNP